MRHKTIKRSPGQACPFLFLFLSFRSLLLYYSSRYGNPGIERHIAGHLDRVRPRSREWRSAQQLTVLEHHLLYEHVRLLCEAGRRSRLGEGLDDRIAPDTRALVVLELEVWVQAGDDGVCSCS